MRLLLLFLCLSTTLFSQKPKDTPTKLFSGDNNVYFRVDLEKPNGIDMRERVMPKSMIDEFEKQGIAVRPSRNANYVSYWAFLEHGEFASMEKLNNPNGAYLSYSQLERIFSKAPRAGTTWKRKKNYLVVAGNKYSIKILEADNLETGGMKGDIEIAFLEKKKKVYYYYGKLIAKNSNKTSQ